MGFEDASLKPRLWSIKFSEMRKVGRRGTSENACKSEKNMGCAMKSGNLWGSCPGISG